ANNYTRDFATRCFDQIEGFGTYGFPESHAASFALLVYVSAWIKCFHPDVFACALLNSQPMGFYAPAQIVRDAREHGVEVCPADINFSQWDCTLEPLKPAGDNPSPPFRGEREGPIAQRWEGEVGFSERSGIPHLSAPEGGEGVSVGPGWRRAAEAIIALVALTIVAGGFVAGLHAGLTYNTFPLMDGSFLPVGYAQLQPFMRNWFENVAAVQFDHRVLAMTTVAAAALLWIAPRYSPLPRPAQ